MNHSAKAARETADETPQKAVWDLAQDVKICMLVTWDKIHLRSRPMTLRSDQGAGEFQFLAWLNSESVADIRSSPEVNLSFSAPGTQDYVSVSGYATVAQDSHMRRDLWTADAERYFGGGPENPAVAVIRVTPHLAESWDGASGTVRALCKFLKRDPAASTEHVKVAF